MRQGLCVLAVGLLATAFGCDKNDPAAGQAAARKAQEHADHGREDIDNVLRSLTGAVGHAAPLLSASMATPGNVARVRNTVRDMHNDTTAIGREMAFVPAFFLAAVGADGKGIAGDRDPDRDFVHGLDLGAAFPCVRQALSGTAASCVGEIETVAGAPPRTFLISAAPVTQGDGGAVGGAMVGAVTLGGLAKSIRIDLEARSTRERVQLSVGILRGRRVFPAGTDSDVVAMYLVPPALVRQVPSDAPQRLARGNGRFTFTFSENNGQQQWGAGVASVPMLGDNAAVVVFRTDLR